MSSSSLNTRHDGEEPHAPAKLVAALKEPPPRRVFVPPGVDDAVRAAARRHFAKPRPFGLGLVRPWLLWPAAAAACLVLAAIGYFVMKPAPATFAREDLNRDGQVDIRDAFALARAVQSGSRPLSPDLNGDGAVDSRDVEAIAARAVTLEKGGRS
jgi:hypothetical protein